MIQGGFDDHWINTAYKLKIEVEQHIKEDAGLVRVTLDVIATMMRTRFAATLCAFDLNPK